MVPDLEEALQHFAHLVEVYYDSTALSSSGAKQEDEPHALLQAVLDVYEQCKGTAGGVVVVGAAAAGRSGREHLQRIGFVPLTSPEGKSMRLVYHEHLAAYESAKSRARSEYHAKRAQQHEADFMGELAGIFDMRHIVCNDDNPHETLFFPEEEDDGEEHRRTSSPLPQAKASVAAFVQKYHKVVGTTPFLKGLRRILEQQVGQTVALQWTLATSVFTESSGPTFLSEALALMHVLRFRPLKLVHIDDGMVSVTWRMCADLSDKDITSLLRAGLTNNSLKKMPGSPTGTVAVSDVQRRLPPASSGGGEAAPPAQGLKMLLRKMKISS